MLLGLVALLRVDWTALLVRRRRPVSQHPRRGTS
jgi:hypothetical protein